MTLARGLLDRLIVAFASLVMVLAFAGIAFSSENDTRTANKQYVVELGLGAMYKPKYPGADSFVVSPFPIISVKRFYVPDRGQVVDGSTSKNGMYIYPSFDFIGSRKSSDSSSLAGTNTIDWALELGLGVGYRYNWFRGFAELRQGINGHEGQVAEFGADIITAPIDRLEVYFGPRATWASNDYMNTYFGVTPAEAATPGAVLPAYRASSSFKTIGLEVRSNYEISERTNLQARGGWDRFVGDAADSPIVNAGSRDQFSIGLGLSYELAFDLFD